MKVYCKKTYSELNKNFYKIGNAGYNQYWDRWIEGNFYYAYKPEQIERNVGIYLWITCENPNESSKQVRGPLTLMNFEKHFMSVIEYRDHLLEQLLNSAQGN